jgi:aspartate 1-decarboxylase
LRFKIDRESWFNIILLKRWGMFRMICRAKIHGATVTETNLNYEGSITLDEELMQEAGIFPGEKVEVFNLNSGARFSTYIIKGKPGSGKVCINGAAARLTQVGDQVIILSYALVSEEEVGRVKGKVLLVDSENKVVQVKEI